MGTSKYKGGTEEGEWEREKEWESKSLREQRALISVGRNAICESVRCLNRDSN